MILGYITTTSGAIPPELSPWVFLYSNLIYLIAVVLFLAWLVYRGMRAAMVIAGIAWIPLVAFPALGLGPMVPGGALIVVAGLIFLYVQLVALWKAACVEFTREDLRRRVEPRPPAAGG
jgi:hypothetical protein